MLGSRPSPRLWLAVVLMLAATASSTSAQIPSITSNGSLGPISWADGYYTIIFNTDAMTIDISTFHGGYSVGGGCPYGTYTGPADANGCARLVSQPGGPDIVVYDFTTVAIYQSNVYVAGSRPAAIAATGAVLIAGAVTANNGYVGGTVAASGAGDPGSGPGGGGGGQGPGWYVTVNDGGYTGYVPLAGGGGGGGGGAWPGAVGSNSKIVIDINGTPNYVLGGTAGLAYMLGYGPVVRGSGGGAGGDRPMWGGPAHYGGMPGGAGGGALLIATPGNLTVSGTLSVAGYPGGASNDGGGGGGGGGGFLVLEVGGNLDIQSTGILTAAGGAGGVGPGGQMNDSYGGKGGGGVIHIDATTITKAGTIDVSGGNAGLVVQTYSIGGTRYIQSGGIETLDVPFTPADGAVSAGNYHGFVRLNVSGSGVSCTPATNDAFYIWNWLSGCGNPNTVPQHDPTWYQLTFGTQPLNLESWLPSRDATQFIYYDIDGTGAVPSRPYVPAYRPDHTYSFVVNTGLVTPGPLHFGVSDGGFGDNSGAYQIRITQLAVAYPLTAGGDGSGSGTVTSQQGLAPQIYCAVTAGVTSGACAEQYPSGTSITLTATPGPGSGFTGWGGACTGTGPCTVSVNQVLNVTATFIPSPPQDFDGDVKSDIVVFRPSTGEWFGRLSSNGYDFQADYLHTWWGSSGDKPVPGDYDGDHKADLMVYRPSTGEWFGRLSSNGYNYEASYLHLWWGSAGDTPVPGDYDGDGKADLMVYRPSTGEWFGRLSSNGYNYEASYLHLWWGSAGDTPVPGDYDGDGEADLMVYRPSTGEWFGRLSGNGYDWQAGFLHRWWGIAGDVTLVGDFDGDGTSDPTVYRPSTGEWFALLSSNGFDWHLGFVHLYWGLSQDIPVLR